MQNEDAQYFINEIKKHPNNPHAYANEELACELYQHVKQEYPEATFYRTSTWQYIVLNEKAAKRLLKKLESETAVIVDTFYETLQEQQEMMDEITSNYPFISHKSRRIKNGKIASIAPGKRS